MFPRQVRFPCGLLVVLCLVMLSATPCSGGELDPPGGPAGDGGTGFSLDIGDMELETPSAVLMDAKTGAVLFAKNPHERRAPASVTKIATLALVFESIEDGRITLDEQVTASPEACRFGGSQIYLEPGEVITVRDLLLAVAVASANDASVALAEHVSGTHEGFVEEMNQLAEHLGLDDTHFVNAHGLDHPEHRTSALDVARLSAYLVCTYPQVLEYTAIWSHYLREDSAKPFWLTNTNKLLKQFPGIDGLKTGSTDEAMYCVSATARRDDTRLIAVTMGAPTSSIRFAEAARLLNAGFGRVETVVIARAGESLGTLPVYEGRERLVEATVEHDVAITIPKGRRDDISHQLVLSEGVVAPVQSVTPVGELVMSLDGHVLERICLVPDKSIERCGPWSLFLRVLGSIWPLKN